MNKEYYFREIIESDLCGSQEDSELKELQVYQGDMDITFHFCIKTLPT